MHHRKEPGQEQSSNFYELEWKPPIRPGAIPEELLVVASNVEQMALYPTTLGIPALREAIAQWCERRFSVPSGWLDPAPHVLPVNGTREALFAFTQTVVNRGDEALVVSPNPFYQIYEGAAYLAGAEPRFLNNLPENDFAIFP